MKHYAAKLLFQYRVPVKGDDGKRRLCEEQIILFDAVSARSALTKAKKNGKKQEFDYVNSAGNKVYYEFVGIMDLMNLGIECANGEVWYEMKYRLRPMERKAILIPTESSLDAIWNQNE